MPVQTRFQAWALKISLVGIIMIVVSILNLALSHYHDAIRRTVATLGFLLIGLILAVTGAIAAFSKKEKQE